MTDIQTIIPLLVLATPLGTLWLFFRLDRYLKLESWANTSDRVEHRRDSRAILERLAKFERNTDYDFRAIKTRLADEESDDQRHKARERYARRTA
jgi:hypothetical protein